MENIYVESLRDIGVDKKIEIDRQLYIDQCRNVDSMCEEAQKKYYQNLILENSGDTKKLYQIANKLLQNLSEYKLPSHSSLEDITERFACYFSHKIHVIRSELETIQNSRSDLTNGEKSCDPFLTYFEPITENEMENIIRKAASKSCQLDPVPTWLLKDCVGILLPVIMKIVNLSLSTGTVPKILKEAILSPLLKKSHLNPNILKNFRPVSNLTFISKLIEKRNPEFRVFFYALKNFALQI
jgi:hypothetical protein